MKSNVALTTGENRSENVLNVLELIRDDIDLSDKKDIFIKVNFVDTRNQLCSTHADGVKSLLAFLRKRYDGKIRIGESHIFDDITVPFERFGYMDILKEYGAEIVDLKHDEWEILHLYDTDMNTMDIHYSKTLLDTDYLISITPPKAHDAVLVSMAIKNVVMGGPSHTYNDKVKIHQGPGVMNLNLYLMAIRHLPDLSIIDGFVGMEGDGPLWGEAVDWKIAVASSDAVAADSLVADMMGFEPIGVGYLYYLAAKGHGAGDISEMVILGENPENHHRKFRPHSRFEDQKKWKDERVDQFLGL
ncbi:MAG: DUF362 domain-containing protein [Dehalococcoidales bacterium]|nr:DUF362 domain-containing protein [Dehalococcoidales bacterium]